MCVKNAITFASLVFKMRLTHVHDCHLQVFKHLFLRNRLATRSQISCGASVGWGNKSLFGGGVRGGLGYMTKMAATHIYMVKTL